MKSLTVVLVAVLASMACEATSVKTTDSSNREVTVEILTEFDGVRLYRVRDGNAGRPIYVAVAGDALRAEWDESHGKTTVRRDTVTVQR